MDLKLNKKTAFISDSKSGIGFSTTKLLLKEGMKVYINGRTQKSVNNALIQLKAEVKDVKVYGITADFLKPELINKKLKLLKKIDVLIKNVGIYSSSSFFDTTFKTYYNQFKVNDISGVSLSRLYLKGMLNQNWGRIIFVSSECVYLVPTDLISYSATKASLHSVSRGLDKITKGTGVTSKLVTPRSTITYGAKLYLEDKAKTENLSLDAVKSNFFKYERNSSLIQRFVNTNEVASKIAYLYRPLSSATNGEIIKVDGGSSGGIF